METQLIRGTIIGWLILLAALVAQAAGPKYRHTPNILNDEIENIYNDIKTARDIEPLSVSTATIRYLIGTTTNDSACLGCVGEYVTATANKTSAATNTYDDLTSISLTAGDWDVWGQINFADNGGTYTQYLVAITGTPGNSSTGQVLGDTMFYMVLDADASLPLVPFRTSIASTTTVYLKYRCLYTGTAPGVYGRISARRVR